jgi:hypothetical protein
MPFFLPDESLDTGVILDREWLRVNGQQVNNESSGKFLKMREVRITGKSPTICSI